jgi:uncharacterized protein (TIGR04222 family)
MSANNAADLAQRLHDYELDQPGAAQPISRRLAQEQGWSAGYTRRVMDEYKRFALLSVVAGHVVTPSDAVDQVWHLHLTYTREYWEHFCPRVLGRPLHHEPSRGGADEQEKYWQLYRQTLASYQQLFGEAAPADIWPAPGERFSARFRRVDSRRFWLLRRPRLELRTALPAAATALAIAGLLAGCARIVDSSSPGSMQGSEFLVFYLWAGALAFGIYLLLRALLLGGGRAGAALSELDQYQLAWLAGGRQRVLQTAVTQLYAEGLLAPSGRTASALKPERALHPIELAVWSAVRARRKPWSGGRTAGVEIDALQSGLRELGLAPDAGQASGISLLGMLVLLPLLGLGLLRLWHGIVNGRPVAFLVMLLLCYAIAACYFFFWPATATARGKARLKEARAAIGPLWRKNVVGISHDQLPRVFALLGASVLSTAAYADLNIYMTGGRRGGGGSDGSSCGSGDGGGGGCGGGGCGG